MKRLVLDSVSSPITRRVYNLGLDEFFEWYGREPRPGFTRATVAAWRVELESRGLWCRIHQRAHHSSSQAGRRGGRQRVAGARVGQRDRAREGRGFQGCPPWELAIPPAGAEAAQHSGHRIYEGPLRSCDPGDAPRLRIEAIRGRRTHLCPRSTARWAMVHRGPTREARPGPDHPDADVGQSRDRRVDIDDRVERGIDIPGRESGRQDAIRRSERKGCVAAPQRYATKAGVPGIAPHDLRRTCAKLCRASGGELEQIQLLLGHASVHTTERYLGTKQDLVHAPNHGIKLRVEV